MRAEDQPQFMKLLAEVMANYGKPLPDAPMVKVWIDALMPFSPTVITKAFTAYAAEKPDFSPVPNSIAARCRLMDGRPTDDEAWAIALSSQNECETVVWTEEMKQAYAVCRTVMNTGDEVGARMAFKDAYNRLVSAARAAGKPAKWDVSEGWDRQRRAEVIEAAVRAGHLLPSPEIKTFLLANDRRAKAYPPGLKRLKEEMAKLEDPNEKAERIRIQRLEEQREAEDERKRELDRQAKQYQAGDKAA